MSNQMQIRKTESKALFLFLRSNTLIHEVIYVKFQGAIL